MSDSDVVPGQSCPGDALDFFLRALRRYPGHVKAGFGLRIDDLPSHYALAEGVRRYESRWWFRRLSKNLYDAPIDTTFALYRPDSEFSYGPAIRSGAPYLARHYPWYSDTGHLTDEEQYYRDHSDPAISHWSFEGHVLSKTPRMSFREQILWHGYVAFLARRDWPVRRGYQARKRT